MATYDVRIVTASYRREPRNGPEQAQLPVIQLFGRTREGQSITIEYSGFQPYFFVVAERFEPCDPFRPALRVLSFDIENSILDNHIFCIRIAYREAGEIKTRILQGKEREIVEGFIKLVHELDPDIISGYNIDGYDLPVLIDRAAKNGIPRLQLARDFSDFFHLGERFWRVDGP